MTAHQAELKSVLSGFLRWERKHADPWDKQADKGFFLRRAREFQKEPGVYAFVSTSDSEIYYMGKATEGIAGRLRTKLRADVRDSRKLSRRLPGGKIRHEYPYLFKYQECDTVVHTKALSDPALGEAALLAAYFFKTLRLPEANRMRAGSKFLYDKECWPLLDEIWHRLLVPIGQADRDFGEPQLGIRRG